MAHYSAHNRDWKSRAVRARGTAVLALGLGLMLVVWGSAGALAVTPEGSTLPGPAPAAAATPGDKDGNRIADGLERKMQGLGANAVLRVIVTMTKGKGVAEARAAAGSFTVIRRFTIINGFTATMTRAQIEALSRAPTVQRIEVDVEIKANLQVAKQAFGVIRVLNNSLAELTTSYDGSGIGICVVDTGIFAGHAEFSGGKVQGFCDAINGGCTAGDPGVPAYDDNGHGTHVSSIAAGNNGVAPGALLWGAKVLDSSGGGTGTTFIAGIEWCVAQQGVDVINASLTAAGSSDGSDALSQAANNAAASKVVVLAAGNTGPGQLQIGAPAAAELPITVGAVADSLSPVGGWRKGLAVFSGRGPTADDRIKPDILAPGVDIEAAWNDGGTLVASGTSMASPFVAGVAALMLHANSGLSPAAVKGIIGDTAVTRGDQSFQDAAGRPKNYDYGWGELDAYAAVAEAEGASTYTPTPFPVELYQNPTIADGASWDYEFEVTDPNTQISANVYNGGQWITMYFPGFGWLRLSRGQDFDVQLHAPQGTPGGTLVDESTCEIDADTACGISTVPALWGRQETLVADPADFPGGVLPLGTWRLHVEAWGDTDGKAQEIIDAVITLGPLGGVAFPVPQGTIDGTVTDGTPGAPSFGQAVAGAAVTADGGENTTTDASGAYSLIVPAGERSITVTATGFDPVTLNNITVADGANVTENFVLIDANDPPSFLSDPIAGAPAEAGTAYAGTLVGTAGDPDFGDILNYSKVSGPAWLIVASNGALSGTPGDGDVGPNGFQVGVNDGNGGSDQATLDINVAAAPPPNVPPVANDDSVATPEDTAAAVTLTGSDPENDPLTFAVVTQPSNGSLSGTPPNLTYTPNLNYFGPDSFTFKANDGTQDGNTATVSITVNAVNDPPVANDDSVATPEDTAAAVTLTGSDPENDPLTFAVVTQPTNGALSGTAPNLTYTPNLNYFGPDSFTFKANDGTVDGNTATVSITVNAVNDPPVANFTHTTNDLTANFTDTSTDGNGTVTGWSWNFGDTGTSTAQNPNHVYATAGTYTVTLTVTDNDGAASTPPAASQQVTVTAPSAVTGDYTWDPAQAVIGNPLTLSAVYTSGTNYAWELISWTGPKKKDVPMLAPVGIGLTAILTAVKASSIVVALTVTGSASDTVTKTITIGSAPPPPATTGSVSGTVSSAIGGIGGATVMADTGESTTADANGLYTLTNVPTGDRTITASASGYVSDGQAVTVAENVTSTLDFTLAEAPVGGGVTVSLTPSSTNHGKTWTATVVVNVTDGGSAVANATVLGTWSDGTSGNCVTNGSGDCPVSLSGIAKKTASRAYVVNAVNGIVSGASVVVLKP